MPASPSLLLRRRGASAAAGLLLLAACDGADGGAAEAAAGGGAPGVACTVEARGVELDPRVEESSGAAFGRRDPGVLWTHGDSGTPDEIWAIAPEGRLLGSVAVEGAKNRDWEDVAAGPCPGGGDCLYLADVGDNRAERAHVSILRLPEPAPGDAAVRAQEHRAAYPDGPRDAESLFVLPDGRAFVVTKGDGRPVQLFHVPLLAAGEVARMEPVRVLAPPAEQPGDRVTGAGASPDGRWVAVRSYRTLAIYETAALLSGGAPATEVDLASLGEAQGEGVAMGAGGRVVLTSEGAGRRVPGTLSRLACSLP